MGAKWEHVFIRKFIIGLDEIFLYWLLFKIFLYWLLFTGTLQKRGKKFCDIFLLSWRWFLQFCNKTSNVKNIFLPKFFFTSKAFAQKRTWNEVCKNQITKHFFQKTYSGDLFPTGTYLCKANNGSTRTICEISSELTSKTPEQHHWSLSGVFCVSFQQVSIIVCIKMWIPVRRYWKLLLTHVYHGYPNKLK